MPPRNLNIIIAAATISALCYFTHRRVRPALIVGDAMNMIAAYYVDPVDDRQLMIAAMNGMTATLDEHSEYIPGEAYETFQDNINQEFAGIGIFVEQPEAGKPVRVVTPLVGSPALAAGLMPGDEIIRVDGEDVSTMTLRDVSARLKGPVGTLVDLTIARAEQELTLTVQRATIELESVVGDYRDQDNRWQYRLRDDPSIAYLRLNSFGEKTTRELEAALTELNNNFQGLVLDLRGNGGGLLHTAADISDMFLNSGNIVSTRTRGGVVFDRFDATRGTLVDADKPIAVLIDGNSASASEIVAACLQDNHRAVVVGTRSYGKGTVQNILPLQYGRSALRLTVAKYYRPNGKNIHRNKDANDDDEWGVSPDPGLEIEMDEESWLKVARRWQESAYPSLAGLDDVASDADVEDVEIDSKLGSPTEIVDPDDSLQSNLRIDPQLRRAVESLRESIEGAVPKAAAVHDPGRLRAVGLSLVP